MKPEVYRCLKMLEAFKVGVMNMWANALTESVSSLQKQYADICSILKKNLSVEEFEHIQLVEPVDLSRLLYPSQGKDALLQRLVVSVEITLAYLRSLDMDLSREVTRKELSLKKKEEELRIKEGEIESMKKVYSELVNIKRGLPELIRSEVTKEIKRNHRGIEEHTNPNTKSQQIRPPNIKNEKDE